MTASVGSIIVLVVSMTGKYDGVSRKFNGVSQMYGKGSFFPHVENNSRWFLRKYDVHSKYIDVFDVFIFREFLKINSESIYDFRNLL